MHVGGKPEKTELTERDKFICKEISHSLIKKGLYFVGIDIIGDYITEINVTSPTGIREIKNLNKEIKRILIPGGINIYTARNFSDGDYKRGIHRGEDMYESNGFIVHFFSKEKVNSLLDGFDNLILDQFEEGKFPRKLYFVVNKKV